MGDTPEELLAKIRILETNLIKTCGKAQFTCPNNLTIMFKAIEGLSINSEPRECEVSETITAHITVTIECRGEEGNLQDLIKGLEELTSRLKQTPKADQITETFNLGATEINYDLRIHPNYEVPTIACLHLADR